ncbi:alpha-L-rhamnosidase N-terminal domain-containing protein [Cohaesibacter intestini]|uniref:alpha-L-rhamnosidase N-terminal domain-containing protein n=1 Tax=Cohaesibacter intestini TaxID=2211145 RepID=UPI000DEAF5DE
MPAPSGVCGTIPTRLRCQHLSEPVGLYEFYINGEQIGHDVMALGWTDDLQLVEYQSHVVTDHLLAGTNCLGAIIGEGWYSGRVGHNQRRAGNHDGRRPAMQNRRRHAVSRRGKMTSLLLAPSHNSPSHNVSPIAAGVMTEHGSNFTLEPGQYRQISQTEQV